VLSPQHQAAPLRITHVSVYPTVIAVADDIAAVAGAGDTS